MQTYIATIKIAVLAESEAEACDALSENLTNDLMYSNSILDWQYTQNEKGEFKYPIPSKDVILKEYIEGNIFLTT